MPKVFSLFSCLCFPACQWSKRY